MPTQLASQRSRASVFAVFITLSLLSLPVLAQTPVTAAPAWFVQHIEHQTGRWVTDNSAYRSEQEPFDEYVLEWRPAIAGLGLHGRMYGRTHHGEGAQQETKTSRDFWEFRVFWHPGLSQVQVQQFGLNGAVGLGQLSYVGAGPSVAGEQPAQLILEQSFYNAQGVEQLGHISQIQGDTELSRAFNISPQHEWQPRRSYLWQREAES